MTDNLPAETQRGILSTVDDETLSKINSWEDALALLQSHGVEVTDITDYGDGFVGVEKDTLVNIPMVVLDYTISYNGEYKDDSGNVMPFVVVRAFTSDGRKVRFTDGSTGLCKQVLGFAKRGVKGGIRCPKGLTVSEYDYIDEKGKHTPAKTFYFTM